MVGPVVAWSDASSTAGTEHEYVEDICIEFFVSGR